MKVILASSSKYRQALLKQIGLPFEVVAPNVDEAAVKTKGLKALAVAEKLATMKGQAVQALHPKALIIASDQVAHINNQILSKPGSRHKAIADLEILQGQNHELITSIWMFHPELGERIETVVAKIKMRPLTSEEISAYVDLDQPLDCAGSYKWEKAGISLIESLDCSDTSAIVGLPLMLLTGILKDWHMPMPFAWSKK